MTPDHDPHDDTRHQAADSPGDHGEDAHDAGHEADVVDVGGVLRIGAGLAVLVVVALLGMWLLFRALYGLNEKELPATATPRATSEPPGPRLDPDQPELLEELREREAYILGTYDWVDRENGVARIPIGRAMEILAEEGLPARSVPGEGTDEEAGVSTTEATGETAGEITDER